MLTIQQDLWLHVASLVSNLLSGLEVIVINPILQWRKLRLTELRHAFIVVTILNFAIPENSEFQESLLKELPFSDLLSDGTPSPKSGGAAVR